ncbi:hypothetical protein AC249_AIPGENE6362 [Exaiptasia diaphana]|nr:hypothetical protein AC249_AIPGENE6362 [Exaiptasia diaphana]
MSRIAHVAVALFWNRNLAFRTSRDSGATGTSPATVSSIASEITGTSTDSGATGTSPATVSSISNEITVAKSPFVSGKSSANKSYGIKILVKILENVLWVDFY